MFDRAHLLLVRQRPEENVQCRTIISPSDMNFKKISIYLEVYLQLEKKWILGILKVEMLDPHRFKTLVKKSDYSRSNYKKNFLQGYWTMYILLEPALWEMLCFTLKQNTALIKTVPFLKLKFAKSHANIISRQFLTLWNGITLNLYNYTTDSLSNVHLQNMSTSLQ